MLVLLFTLLFAASAQAASLEWDDTAEGTIAVEFSSSPDGPFTTIASIPAQPSQYPLTPGKFGFYRVSNVSGSSNVVKFSLDIEAGEDARLDALETRVSLLEKPVAVTNITAKQLDANRIEVTGQACTSLKTTGTGLKRIIECIK